MASKLLVVLVTAALLSGCSSEDQVQVTCEDVRNAVAAVPPRGCDFGDASAWYPKQCLPGEGYRVTDARKCVDLLNTATCADIAAGPQGTVCAMVPLEVPVDAGLDSSSKVQVDALVCPAKIPWQVACEATCDCFTHCAKTLPGKVCLPRCMVDGDCVGKSAQGVCDHIVEEIDGVCR